MYKSICIIFISVTLLVSCKKQADSNKNADLKSLALALKNINDQVDTAKCVDSKKWSFLPIGSKACGGPTGYIAYPHTIDTTQFIKQVRLYTQQQQYFNMKYNIASDCMYMIPPYAVICDNGNPVLIYKNL